MACNPATMCLSLAPPTALICWILRSCVLAGAYAVPALFVCRGGGHAWFRFHAPTSSRVGPPRFDRLLYLGTNMDTNSKLSILKALTRKFTLGADVRLDHVAAACGDFTGADFYAVCSNALAAALKRRARQLQTRLGMCAMPPPPPLAGWLAVRERQLTHVRVR